MDDSTQAIVIIVATIIVALFVIYRLNPGSTENFESMRVKRSDDAPGYFDNQYYVNNMDPDTVDKLKQTILRTPSLGSAAEVAYNDIVSYRKGQIRPFNEADSLVSQALAESDSFNADMFGNTYYMLWKTDQEREAELVKQRAEKIIESGKNCVTFKNVNQCMSVCNDTEECTGFYIDSPNKCCMMVDPPYATNRHRFNKQPNNLDEYGQRTVNQLIRRESIADKKKVIFDYVTNDGGNSAYRVNMNRKQCKSLCPKCIMGRCPENYRCTDMTADPRYNYSCIITNEDRYNEKTGDTYDADYIPHLDAIYALNQYAGYDDIDEDPVLMLPETDRLELTDMIVPTQKELDDSFKRYDQYHIGPYTGVDELDYDLARKTIQNNMNEEIYRYNAAKESDNPDTLATRGENDPIALASYYKYADQPVEHKPTVTKKQIENFRAIDPLNHYQLSRDDIVMSYEDNFN